MPSEPTPDRPEADAPQSPPTTTADQANENHKRQPDRPELFSSKPAAKLPGGLPPWKLLLHNDDVNDRRHVVECLISLAGLQEQDAVLRMHEAEAESVSLVLTTHKEKAELHQQQLASCNLTVTIEPGE